MTQDELNNILDRPDGAAIIAPLLEWRAVLVVDMAGFSDLTRDEGVAVALKRVREFRLFAAHAVTMGGGHFVKCYADNILATFRNERDAITVAEYIVKCERASAGVATGYVLLIDGDVYGHAVNVASKLGEDAAKPGEVLTAESAPG